MSLRCQDADLDFNVVSETKILIYGYTKMGPSL